MAGQTRVKAYEFGPFRLDADAEILFRGTEPVTLGQRAVALLRVLVQRAGVPVSKDALIEAAWPGLVVEEANLTVQIAALRRVLGEEPGGEHWIETLQRRGYRYVGPVVATEDSGRVDAGTPPPIPALALPEKPSVAVLPFANLSGDPEQEYFADGVVEDITTKLSRFRELFVTARNSTFSYKGKSPDIRQVGKELGVRYVLEGSVRRAGNRIRVTAQLIDSLTGGHVWAETYDRMLEDVFELQEQLTASIVGTISATIVTAEIEQLRQRRPASLSAYEAALRAKALGWEAFRKNDPALTEQAVREANAALAIDPTSVQALCALAQAHWQQVYFKSTADPDVAWQAGYDAASRAIELDPANEEGYRRKAQLCLRDDAHLDEALLNARRACELNPNNAYALNYLGLSEVKRGNLPAAIEHLQRSIRISPRDPLKPNSSLAFAYFHSKDYAAALEQAQIAISEAPNSPLPMALAAVSYVGLNELDKAKAVADRARRIAPNFREAFAMLAGGHRNPEHRSRLTTFINVACGTEQPAAADALR